MFFRHPSTLNQAISFAEELFSFNVQCLDVSGEETVDDVPVEREQLEGLMISKVI